MKKQFLILFTFISVLALSQVPQRFNKVIVTGDITSPKFIKTGSNADSVLLGNGSARAISTIKTDTVSLSNRINAKATGNGTANGTNTGDETLTSIKTKLGAATSVSDGYLKYQDWSIFNSKEPAITKNTAFNKNFGTTTGTVLEGRTFGTAASSSVGDFIQNQNSSAQSANQYIAGTSNVGGLRISGDVLIPNGVGLEMYYNASNKISFINSYDRGVTNSYHPLYFNASEFNFIGAATFSSTVNSTGFLLNGNNLTSSLTTNYIPKWNGSSLVNATAGTDYQLPITLTTNGTSGAATFSGNVLNVPNYTSSGGVNQTQTTVNGSTSGNMVCSMPFQTGSYKKVMIRINSLNGSVSYTFPTSFQYPPTQQLSFTNSLSVTGMSETSISFSSTNGATGWVILQGY